MFFTTSRTGPRTASGRTGSLLILALALAGAAACRKNVGGNLSGGGTTTPPATDTVPTLATIRAGLVDRNATDETAALFYRLGKVAANNILFGHQDDTKRGVVNATSQWANEQQYSGIATTRSDVKDLTGAYPAVYGHDFLHIAGFATGPWFDYEASIARQLTIEAYNRGGVNTYCWHLANPVSQGSFYWNDSPVEAVSRILPGGSHNDVFKSCLRKVAAYAQTLVGADGKPIPITFRPFHEFDGDWFWWGSTHCTPAQYKQLYRFTVTYLRDSLGVHNFLYAWSPDRNFTSTAQYLERYPGDDCVDIVGTDNYGDLADAAAPSVAADKFLIVSDYAAGARKVAAVTETGSTSNLAKTDWFTANLLRALTIRRVRMAYVMVWANTSSSYYTPYAGHPAAADFQRFKGDTYLLFSDRLPSMYRLN